MLKRKRKHEEHENHERWLVSYADFITLLFAFFTVLYATSQNDPEKEKEFEKSVRKQFAGILGMASPFGEFAMDSRNNAIIQPPIETFPPMDAGPEEVEDYVHRRLENDLTEEQLKAAIAGVKHDAVGVRIQLAASLVFPAGSSDIKMAAAETLEKIGKMLKDSNRRVIVEGHTDDEPVRSEKYPSNWELSASRATRLVRYLIQKHGVPPSRLTAVAHADQKPIAPNSNDENRAKNRRIELLIVTGSGK